MTHGLAGFQNLMLKGIPVAPLSWIGLVVIAVVTFFLVVVITSRQLRKA
jgi:ABC-2 type transport system permease protein